MSLSGVHDLRPLLGTRDLNGVLRMDEAEALQFSPVLLRPKGAFDLSCVCGADELPEFRRLNGLQANMWAGLGLATESLECEACNHFTLLDLMTDPDSALTRLLTGRPAADGGGGMTGSQFVCHKAAGLLACSEASYWPETSLASVKQSKRSRHAHCKIFNGARTILRTRRSIPPAARSPG